MMELTPAQLECLNGWPEESCETCQGVVGHTIDAQLIVHLNELCKQHGYGRMGQLMGAMEEIWRDPDAGLAKWQKFHDERMELLKESLAYYNKKKKKK